MPPRFAKNLLQQFTRAVGHFGLLGESRVAAHKNAHAHNFTNSIQSARRIRQYREPIQNRLPRRRRRGLDGCRRWNGTSCDQLSILKRKLPAHINQVSSSYKRNVSRDWLGGRRQGKSKNLQTIGGSFIHFGILAQPRWFRQRTQS